MVLEHQYTDFLFSHLVLLHSCSLPQDTRDVAGDLAESFSKRLKGAAVSCCPLPWSAALPSAEHIQQQKPELAEA